MTAPSATAAAAPPGERGEHGEQGAPGPLGDDGAAGPSHLVQLRAAGACAVLDVAGPALPRVLHWGADPGPLDAGALAALALAAVPPVPGSSFDAPRSLPLLPTERDGWSGTPGLGGSRAGGDGLPPLALVEPAAVQPPEPEDGGGVGGRGGGGSVTARAAGGGLVVEVVVVLDAHGLLRVRTRVEGAAATAATAATAADGTGRAGGAGAAPYDLAPVVPLLPLPPRAGEVLDLTGRWLRERSPERSPLGHGTHWRAGRRGRSGHDAPLLLVAGTPGFGFRSGEVWATSVAWSGDAVHLVEHLPEGAGAGAAVLGGGELLRPGEVRLGPGDAYEAPETVFAWSDRGLDGLSARVHRALRARPHHPRAPRPLTLNVWEAVYFDHSLEALSELAEVAADLGVERFVLDDGWFGSRRDDSSGLGDWYVSDEVWPDGLAPLFDRVRALGMQVGLWFEPEMANPDSDLVRAHPEWLLTPDAPLWRGQQVLDLAHPGAFAHLLERLDALVGDLGVDFVKWDHNRDLHVALHARADGVRAPGVHGQTAALYRLLDALRARHPHLEVESCASGGGRVDLGVLEHTDRVWTSDCNDALERQLVQRWTGLLLPPELLGAHVGPERSHTTGRVLGLAFRCATALFGHAGLEMDVRALAPAERDAVRAWAALYREQRDLLHSGDVVRADLPGEDLLLHGVVARDGSRALFAAVRLATGPDAVPGRVGLPGLDPARTYAVRLHEEVGPAAVTQHREPAWVPAARAGALRLPGAVLASAGLALPVLDPASALLVELVADPRG